MSRLLAIGDIHGCLCAFDRLLGALELSSSDTLVLLGDFVDRGPDSRGVMERILELHTQLKLVPLFGNHEEMMCEAARGADARNLEPLSNWVNCGGDVTLTSYAGRRTANRGEIERLKAVPEEHWRFLLRQCRDHYETASYMFAHATVLPQVSLSEQPLYALRWRKLYDPQPHISGKTVVVGHTRQPHGKPRSWGHTLALDTGAYAGEWLTAVSLDEHFVWQANQEGQLHEGSFASLVIPVEI